MSKSNNHQTVGSTPSTTTNIELSQSNWAQQQQQQQQQLQHQRNPTGPVAPSQVSVSSTTTSTTPSGVNVTNDPTIQLFNRFVAKDTHCLMGKTGIKISRICLGSMNFGHMDPSFGTRPGQLSESEAHKILDRFVELGGNCIDTADFFPWFGSDVGKTETIIGNWLSKQNRERIFLITKVRMPIDPSNLNSVGLSRSHLIDSVHKSLKRLQTNTIDMLVLNGWDQTVSFHDTIKTLNDLISCDKIRYIGVCDMKGWQLQKFIDSAKRLDLQKCVCYMGEYNLLTRGCELEVIDVCKNERIGFIAYSPLKYGFLTNDQLENPNAPVKGSRIEAATLTSQNNRMNLAAMAESFECLRNNPVNLNVLGLCQQLAQRYNVSVSQIAIQWLLQTGVVTSVCVGVESVNELEECMRCLLGEFVLSPQEMDQLDLASSVHLHYPYHTQFADVAGLVYLQPLANTEFEQLNVLTHALGLGGMRQHRMNVSGTWHESTYLNMPERENMRYFQTKANIQQQTPVSSIVAAQANLNNQGKIIQ